MKAKARRRETFQAAGGDFISDCHPGILRREGESKQHSHLKVTAVWCWCRSDWGYWQLVVVNRYRRTVWTVNVSWCCLCRSSVRHNNWIIQASVFISFTLYVYVSYIKTFINEASVCVWTYKVTLYNTVCVKGSVFESRSDSRSAALKFYHQQRSVVVIVAFPKLTVVMRISVYRRLCYFPKR